MRGVVVGYGGVGRRRAAILAADPRVDLAGIADHTPGRGVDPDYRRLIERARPDAVVVATPNELHLPVALHALAHGAHVLVEKPLARTLAEGEALVAAARLAHRTVKLGANHHYFPSVIAARRLLAEGAIGRLVSARIEVGHGRLLGLPGWFRDPIAGGGGTLLDNGSHAALLATRLLAAEGDAAQRATCDVTWRAGVDVDARARLWSRQGRLVELHATWIGGPGYRFFAELTGTHGRLVIHHPAAVSLNGRPVPVDDAGGLGSWELDTDDFIRAVLSGDPPEIGAAEALDCLRLLAALYRAERQGAPTLIPA